MVALLRAFSRRSVASASRQERERTTLHQFVVSRCHYGFLWTAAFLSHAISALYLTVVATVHLALLLGPNFVQLSQVTKHFVLVGILYACLALLHGSRVFMMCLWSLQARKLVFGHIQIIQMAAKLGPPIEAVDPTHGAVRSVVVSCWRRLWRQPRRFWRKYLAPRGLFGVFGPYYDRRIGLRDLIDVPSHIIQAYSMSFFVQPWPCVVVGFLIMMECMSHLVLHWIMRDYSDFTRRSNMVLCDMVLDATLGAIAPLALFLPQLVQYMSHLVSINTNYSDIWYTETVLRLQHVVVKDFLDFLTKVCPFYFNYWTLSTFSSLFSMHLLQQHGQQSSTASSTNSNFSQIHPHRSMASSRTTTQRTHARVQWILLVYRSFRWISAAVGLSVFLLALQASGFVITRASCPHNCLLRTSPWLSSSCHCVVQEFNCLDLDPINTTDNLSSILTKYDEPASLNIIVFNQCPALFVPSSIRRFKNLFGISVYNSELVDWSVQAAVTGDAFPVISYILFVKTNVSIIPSGLMTNLAPTVFDIEIIASDTPPTIPDAIATSWTNVSYIFIERSHLTEVPAPLLKLSQLKQLSLACNNLTGVPDRLLMLPSIERLFLSGNPLQELPQSSFRNGTRLQELYLDYTSIQSIPAMQDGFNATLAVSAWQSPLCQPDHVTSHPGITVACNGLHRNWFRLGVYPFDDQVKQERLSDFLSDLI